MAASSTPMFPPPFSARPIRAPSTWRPFASPRSWSTSSWICASPEAPIGCPRHSRPPLCVHRLSAAQARGARLGERPSLPDGAEAHGLGLVQLAPGRRVVELGQAHVGRACAGLLVGRLREALSDVRRVEIAVGALREHGGPLRTARFAPLYFFKKNSRSR